LRENAKKVQYSHGIHLLPIQGTARVDTPIIGFIAILKNFALCPQKSILASGQQIPIKFLTILFLHKRTVLAGLTRNNFT
jgi:hypothetical protein